MIPAHILDLAQICAQKGVNQFILSPGSRCAPITLAMTRHPEIRTRTVSDERSAAFIGLGIAQQSRKTVGLVCTSGSAAYNYAPAIAEAFFQQIPLLVITADRPSEWIDQLDGQTIRQIGIYGNHVKGSFQLPILDEHPDTLWHIQRMINEAINLSQSLPLGPVHINIPLREPFYPKAEEQISFRKDLKIIEKLGADLKLSPSQINNLSKSLQSYKRPMIVVGQQVPDENINNLLQQIHQSGKAVVVTDVIANQAFPGSIQHHDFFLPLIKDVVKDYTPDLIITFGLSIISKNLKLFLRNEVSRAAHWHIQAHDGATADTFKKLTQVWTAEPLAFLEAFDTHAQANAEYHAFWISEESKINEILVDTWPKLAFGELKAYAMVQQKIPANSYLHLANSMTVRYANMLQSLPRSVEVMANRGTSGIDGSNSTAVGASLNTDAFVTLITGDMAFFYDRNAFWHNYPLANLRIIVLNNQAGGIFRMIDGPAAQPELVEYFETRQLLKAQNLADEFGFDYHGVNDTKGLETALENFYQPSQTAKLIEVFSTSETNTNILKAFKQQIKTAYEI